MATPAQTLSAARRQLDFADFDAVATDVDRLHGGGYARAGNWTLAQACDHLSKFMAASLEGFPVRLPWVVRFVGRHLFLPRTLKTRRIPAGVKGPAPFMPAADAGDDAAAVERFKQVLARVRDPGATFHPSPLFGNVTPDQWRQLHLIHAAHHLSFLVPNSMTPPASPSAA